MSPADRARVCARCDKAVHDLAQFEFDEAEALLSSGPEICVRARIGADGAVALKPGLRCQARSWHVAGTNLEAALHVDFR